MSRKEDDKKFFGNGSGTAESWITTNTAEPRGVLTPEFIRAAALQRDPRYAHLPEATVVREQRERFAEAMVAALFGEPTT